MQTRYMLHHEAAAIAASHGLAGLPEVAAHLHTERAIRRDDAAIDMTSSEHPTSVVGFCFNPGAGLGVIVQATVGASHEENGLEGLRITFEPEEATQAQAALLAELGQYAPKAVASV